MRQILFILFLLSGTSLVYADPSDYPFFTPDYGFHEDRSGLPVGDYQNKCKNCRIDNDGLLVCDCPVKREMLNTIGSFSKSCRNCTIQGDNLYCLCDKTQCDWSDRDVTKGRNRQRAMLQNFRNCSSKVINCNGYLRCGECGFTDFWDESRRPKEGHSSMKSCDTFYLPF